MDIRQYLEGYAFDCYEFFGAHLMGNGVLFRTYAPRAQEVSLIGDFNDWQGQAMQNEGGIWSLHVPGAKVSQFYKFRIKGADGQLMEKADPYAFSSELRPKTASVIYDHSTYRFEDAEWMSQRSNTTEQPISIYELHLGSWRTKVHELGETYEGQVIEEEEDNWFNYRDLAEPLANYVKDMGYTHVEFMPIYEYPLDASWGYQPSGFFSATSRYGSPDDLKFLIDHLHQSGIGVILDIVPVHFVSDAFALGNYDGTALYEYPHPDVGFSEWGSYNFMHSRGEVRSFLQSMGAYWLDKFHIDGLRYDAVSRLIYWQGEEDRGTIDHTILFLKNMNQGLHDRFPEVILIAEDSTSYPGVTRPVKDGGLGFDYKWDMGFMHDTLDFFKTAPWLRTEHYNKLTFSMMYFYNERYMLPFSHDEVVHGKATISQKMFGDYEEKFPQSRALYMYMFAHPGKKLNFMGNDFAQLREWDEKREQDWPLLIYPNHDSHLAFFKALNHLYLEYPELYEGEYNPEAYQWVVVDDGLGVVYAFYRGLGKRKIFFVFNLCGQVYDFYTFDLLGGLIKEELLNSDWEEFGGKTARPDDKNQTWYYDAEKKLHGLTLQAYNGRAFLVEF